MYKEQYTALILAAGFSTRMQGLYKPLLPLTLISDDLTSFQSYSALEIIAKLYAKMGIRQVYVVSGQRQRQDLQNTIADINAQNYRGLKLFEISNPCAEDGMFSSICIGLKEIADKFKYCFIHPVDIPLVRQLTIDFLLKASFVHAKSILIPCYHGQSGHPPLIPLCYSQHILDFNQNMSPQTLQGLQGALYDLPKQYISTADSHILHDMDTQKDYDFLHEQSTYQHILSEQEALELLHCLQVPKRGIEHAQAVANIASSLAAAYNDKFGSARMDVDMVKAAALLHDMCKTQKQHDKLAGKTLRHIGLEILAPLVEDHTDLDLDPSAKISERELVYIADKFVIGSRAVSIKERFGQKMELYAHIPEACLAINERMQRALKVEQRIYDDLGRR